jgi:NifU-like protein involved in Fe-S cluster formation
MLMVCFVAQDLGLAADVLNVVHHPPSTTRPLINISSDLGLIRQSSLTSAPSGEMIINIQDAHSKLGAQESISKILDSLVKNYHLQMVAIEGASTFVDTSVLSTFPIQKIKEKVGENLLKEGKISAASFYSAITQEKVSVYGVEDAALYRQNVETFKSLIEQKPRIRQELKSLKKSLKNLGDSIYSPQLKEVLNKRLLHQNGDIKFTEYWQAFSQKAKEKGIDFHAYPNLDKLSKTMALENKIDFKAASTERDTLMESLGQVLEKKNLQDLILKSLEFKKNKISPSVFHDHLFQAAVQAGADLTLYPNLALYTDYVGLYETIDLIQIFDEVSDFEDTLKEKLFTTQDERTLSGLERCANILIQLLDTTLTSKDYDFFVKNEASCEIETIQKTLQALSEKYKVQSFIDFDYLAVQIPSAKKFYELAQARDKALLENTLKQMRLRGQKVAALVTGGFHSEGLTELMAQQKLSYLVVMPKFDEKSPDRPYFTVLTQKPKQEEGLYKDSEFYVAAPDSFAQKGFQESVIKQTAAEAKGQFPNKHPRMAAKAGEWSQNYQQAAARLAKEGTPALLSAGEFESSLARALDQPSGQGARLAESLADEFIGTGSLRYLNDWRDQKLSGVLDEKWKYFLDYFVRVVHDSKDYRKFLVDQISITAEKDLNSDTLFSEWMTGLDNEVKNFLNQNNSFNLDTLKGRKGTLEGQRETQKVGKMLQAFSEEEVKKRGELFTLSDQIGRAFLNSDFKNLGGFLKNADKILNRYFAGHKRSFVSEIADNIQEIKTLYQNIAKNKQESGLHAPETIQKHALTPERAALIENLKIQIVKHYASRSLSEGRKFNVNDMLQELRIELLSDEDIKIYLKQYRSRNDSMKSKATVRLETDPTTRKFQGVAPPVPPSPVTSLSSQETKKEIDFNNVSQAMNQMFGLKKPNGARLAAQEYEQKLELLKQTKFAKISDITWKYFREMTWDIVDSKPEYYEIVLEVLGSLDAGLTGDKAFDDYVKSDKLMEAVQAKRFNQAKKSVERDVNADSFLSANRDFYEDFLGKSKEDMPVVDGLRLSAEKISVELSPWSLDSFRLQNSDIDQFESDFKKAKATWDLSFEKIDNTIKNLEPKGYKSVKNITKVVKDTLREIQSIQERINAVKLKGRIQHITQKIDLSTALTQEQKDFLRLARALTSYYVASSDPKKKDVNVDVLAKSLMAGRSSKDVNLIVQNIDQSKETGVVWDPTDPTGVAKRAYKNLVKEEAPAAKPFGFEDKDRMLDAFFDQVIPSSDPVKNTPEEKTVSPKTVVTPEGDDFASFKKEITKKIQKATSPSGLSMEEEITLLRRAIATNYLQVHKKAVDVDSIVNAVVTGKTVEQVSQIRQTVEQRNKEGKIWTSQGARLTQAELSFGVGDVFWDSDSGMEKKIVQIDFGATDNLITLADVSEKKLRQTISGDLLRKYLAVDRDGRLKFELVKKGPKPIVPMSVYNPIILARVFRENGHITIYPETNSLEFSSTTFDLKEITINAIDRKKVVITSLDDSTKAKTFILEPATENDFQILFAASAETLGARLGELAEELAGILKEYGQPPFAQGARLALTEGQKQWLEKEKEIQGVLSKDIDTLLIRLRDLDIDLQIKGQLEGDKRKEAFEEMSEAIPVLEGFLSKFKPHGIYAFFDSYFRQTKMYRGRPQSPLSIVEEAVDYLKRRSEEEKEEAPAKKGESSEGWGNIFDQGDQNAMASGSNKEEEDPLLTELRTKLEIFGKQIGDFLSTGYGDGSEINLFKAFPDRLQTALLSQNTPISVNQKIEIADEIIEKLTSYMTNYQSIDFGSWYQENTGLANAIVRVQQDIYFKLLLDQKSFSRIKMERKKSFIESIWNVLNFDEVARQAILDDLENQSSKPLQRFNDVEKKYTQKIPEAHVEASTKRLKKFLLEKKIFNQTDFDNPDKRFLDFLSKLKEPIEIWGPFLEVSQSLELFDEIVNCLVDRIIGDEAENKIIGKSSFYVSLGQITPEVYKKALKLSKNSKKKNMTPSDKARMQDEIDYERSLQRQAAEWEAAVDDLYEMLNTLQAQGRISIEASKINLFLSELEERQLPAQKSLEVVKKLFSSLHAESQDRTVDEDVFLSTTQSLISQALSENPEASLDWRTDPEVINAWFADIEENPFVGSEDYDREGHLMLEKWLVPSAVSKGEELINEIRRYIQKYARDTEGSAWIFAYLEYIEQYLNKKKNPITRLLKRTQESTVPQTLLKYMEQARESNVLLVVDHEIKDEADFRDNYVPYLDALMRIFQKIPKPLLWDSLNPVIWKVSKTDEKNLGAYDPRHTVGQGRAGLLHFLRPEAQDLKRRAVDQLVENRKVKEELLTQTVIHELLGHHRHNSKRRHYQIENGFLKLSLGDQNFWEPVMGTGAWQKVARLNNIDKFTFWINENQMKTIEVLDLSRLDPQTMLNITRRLNAQYYFHPCELVAFSVEGTDLSIEKNSRTNAPANPNHKLGLTRKALMESVGRIGVPVDPNNKVYVSYLYDRGRSDFEKHYLQNTSPSGEPEWVEVKWDSAKRQWILVNEPPSAGESLSDRSPMPLPSSPAPSPTTANRGGDFLSKNVEMNNESIENLKKEVAKIIAEDQNPALKKLFASSQKPAPASEKAVELLNKAFKQFYDFHGLRQPGKLDGKSPLVSGKTSEWVNAVSLLIHERNKIFSMMQQRDKAFVSAAAKLWNPDLTAVIQRLVLGKTKDQVETITAGFKERAKSAGNLVDVALLGVADYSKKKTLKILTSKKKVEELEKMTPKDLKKALNDHEDLEKEKRSKKENFQLEKREFEKKLLEPRRQAALNNQSTQEIVREKKRRKSIEEWKKQFVWSKRLRGVKDAKQALEAEAKKAVESLSTGEIGLRTLTLKQENELLSLLSGSLEKDHQQAVLFLAEAMGELSIRGLMEEIKKDFDYSRAQGDGEKRKYVSQRLYSRFLQNKPWFSRLVENKTDYKLHELTRPGVMDGKVEEAWGTLDKAGVASEDLVEKAIQLKVIRPAEKGVVRINDKHFFRFFLPDVAQELIQKRKKLIDDINAVIKNLEKNKGQSSFNPQGKSTLFLEQALKELISKNLDLTTGGKVSEAAQDWQAQVKLSNVLDVAMILKWATESGAKPRKVLYLLSQKDFTRFFKLAKEKGLDPNKLEDLRSLISAHLKLSTYSISSPDERVDEEERTLRELIEIRDGFEKQKYDLVSLLALVWKLDLDPKRADALLPLMKEIVNDGGLEKAFRSKDAGKIEAVIRRQSEIFNQVIEKIYPTTSAEVQSKNDETQRKAKENNSRLKSLLKPAQSPSKIDSNLEIFQAARLSGQDLQLLSAAELRAVLEGLAGGLSVESLPKAELSMSVKDKEFALRIDGFILRRVDASYRVNLERAARIMTPQTVVHGFDVWTKDSKLAYNLRIQNLDRKTGARLTHVLWAQDFKGNKELFLALHPEAAIFDEIIFGPVKDVAELQANHAKLLGDQFIVLAARDWLKLGAVNTENNRRAMLLHLSQDAQTTIGMIEYAANWLADPEETGGRIVKNKAGDGVYFPPLASKEYLETIEILRKFERVYQSAA